MARLRRVIVIYSPYSGRSTHLSQTLTYLRQLGIEIVDGISITTLDSLPVQGTHWRESGIDVAVAAGGDGLVGGVIMHIAESSLPLGILPLGTSNDIARSLDIPQDLQQASEVIVHGKEREVDIGVACPAEQPPHPVSPMQGKPVPLHLLHQRHGFFAHALTVGLNVQFARLATNTITRQRYKRLTYPLAALEVLRNHTALELELHFEGLALLPMAQQPATTPMPTDEEAIFRCRALQVAVINAPIFGGVWQLTIPGARFNDRLLDIVVLEDVDLGNLSQAITHFFSDQEQSPTGLAGKEAKDSILSQAELTGIPGIHHFQAQGVIITTHIDPQDVTLDGEVRGQTPTHVHVADERLRVVVPQ